MKLMILCLISAQLVEISTQTGVVLDPVYTLKGVRGMLSELQKNPGRFRGRRILYIHTGWFRAGRRKINSDDVVLL